MTFTKKNYGRTLNVISFIQYDTIPTANHPIVEKNLQKYITKPVISNSLLPLPHYVNSKHSERQQR